MTDHEFAEAFGGLLHLGMVDAEAVGDYGTPRFRPTALCSLALEFERRQNPGAAGNGDRGAAFPPITPDGCDPPDPRD